MTAPQQPALQDIFVSVVMPLSGRSILQEPVLKEIYDLLLAHYTNFEIIVVVDKTPVPPTRELVELAQELRNVRMLHLSRGYGIDNAVLAGLDISIGDFVVVLLPGFDPPAEIVRLIDKAGQGNDVVIGIPETRKPDYPLQKMVSGLFHAYYWHVFRMSMYAGSSYFRAFGRAAVNAMLSQRGWRFHLRHSSVAIGFQSASLAYTPVSAGSPGVRGFWKDLSAAADIIVSNSKHPLRLVALLGLTASSLNLLYLFYVAAIYVFKDHVAEGWTTLSLQNGVMFFLIFLILTVLCEYVARVLQEAQKRPHYLVEREAASSTELLPADRRNVVSK